MTSLFRILMMIVGYIWACIAASLVLTLGSLAPGWNDFNSLGQQSGDLQSVTLWSIVGVGAAAIAAIAFMPTLIAIAITEGFALRSVIIYGVIGGALALASAYGLDFAGYVAQPGSDFAHQREVIAAAGIAGGLVYWLFAGRRAGRWK
jgi:hypothetical protein